MRKYRRFQHCRVLNVILAASVLGFSAAAETREMEEDFAWLESLGLPNPEDLSFARVVLPRFTEEEESRYVYGFISQKLELPLEIKSVEEGTKNEPTASKTTHEKILTVDLQWIPLSLFVAGDGFQNEKKTFRLEKAELAEYAAIFLDPQFKRTWHRRMQPPHTMGESQFPRRSHLFLLSWFLKNSNSPALSKTVYDQALALPLPYDFAFPWGLARGRKAESFHEALSMEFDQTLYVHALERFVGFDVDRLEFGFDPARHLFEFNPHQARIRLLADFENLQRHFPNAAEIAFVEHAIPILRTMVAEDRDHPPITVKEIGALPHPIAIEEWIFRLRDSLSVSRGSERNNPFFEGLINTQPESIPHLIDAIDDGRFVRSLANYGGSAVRDGLPYLHTVGDAAAALLRHISGEEFFLSTKTFSKWEERIEFRKDLKQKAIAWWENVQRLGGEEYLVTVVNGGGRHGASMLRRLQERHKDRFVEAALAGLKATPEDLDPRLRYIEALARIEGEEIDELYHDELKNGPDFQTRLASAKILFRRGFQREAVEAMLGEWRNRERVEEQHSEPGNPDLPRLLEFLLTCDDPAAVRQIASDYADLPPLLRHRIVSQLKFYRNVLGEMAPPKYSDAFRDAVYEFLFVAWDDDTLHGEFGAFSSRALGTPNSQKEDRIGDIAGEALRKWWPTRISVKNKSQLPDPKAK